MPESADLYIGLISGTSADAVDAALVDFSGASPILQATLAYPLPDTVRDRLYPLMVPGNNEIDAMGVLDQQLGSLFADAALQLIARVGVKAKDIKAIGSHGQTLRHRPPGELERAFTLQIADPSRIAEITGITTVADFRRRDMAAGGQGAPLVPGFHRAIFSSDQCDRVIVNIGGISNITLLPHAGGHVLGFDTGPGNALMDLWIGKHKGERYDRDGQWSTDGKVNDDLLQTLLKHPFFAQAAPKSTGREMFTLDWLESALAAGPDLPAADVQATLVALAAATIAREIRQLNASQPEIYVCGGGAWNTALMARLQRELAPAKVATTAELGMSPDWVEGAAFAWLARQTLAQQPGSVASVTGASHDRILGGVYFS